MARSSSRWYDSCGGQQRHVARVRQRSTRTVVREAAEVEAQHGQGAPDRVEVGCDRGTPRSQLRCLVPGGAPQRGGLVVDPPHRAEVDQLELLLGVDDVVRLEVAEQQPPVVQVAQGRQHLDAVGEHLVQRQRRRAARPGRCGSARGPSATGRRRTPSRCSRRRSPVFGSGCWAKSWTLTMFGWSTSTRNRRSATAAAIASGSPVLIRPLSTTQRSRRRSSLMLRSRAR